MKSSTGELVRRYRWDDMPAEKLKKGLSRKLITGDRMMIAHVYFESGEEVPRHSRPQACVGLSRQKSSSRM